MEREAAIAALVSLPEVQRINVARLKPSDVIVVELAERVPMEAVEHIKASLVTIFPGNKVIICDEGTRLRVVDGADAEETTEGSVV